MKSIKNNPKIMKAWAFYDWANSVYSLVITTTIFPIYYSLITTAGYKLEYVQQTGKWVEVPIRNLIKIFGKTYEPDAVYVFSLTVSFFIVVLISPVLSSLADTIGNKKSFLQFFAYLGAISCMGLALFTSINTVFLGLLFSILASVGFWGSLVFYNSFLPDIATPEKQDALSARGYVYGYIGSVILVIISLLLVMEVAETPEETRLWTRFTFLLTGAWWFGFSQYTFKYLPRFGEVKDKLPKDLVLINLKTLFQDNKKYGGFVRILKDNLVFYSEIIKESFKELFRVGHELFKTPNLKFFLASFFFYSVGIQTIFLIATPFGKNEIGLESNQLIITLLVIQIVAIFGSIIFSKLSKTIGNKNVISITIIIWIAVCLIAYTLKRENPNVKTLFYIEAAIIGLVMGGIQSMSRSTYSRLLPKDSEDSTTYFSFYDVLEKIAIIIGTFIFAVLIDKYAALKSFMQNDFNLHLPATSGMRFAALAMTVFFVIGLIFIRFLKMKRQPDKDTL